MFKKVVTTILIAMTTVFAQNLKSQEEVVPFVFSWSSSQNEAANPYANSAVNFHLSMISGRVGSVQGLQIGLFNNYVKNDFIGYDANMIYSRVDGNYAGVQSVGIVSKVNGDFIGIQDNGIYSRVGGDFFGIQSTGLISITDGDLKGGQFSGILSRAQNVTGIQTSGIVNEAKDLTGVQIGGIVNKADHVKGVQIGLINRSKKLDGIAIGLVNLSDEGSVHAIAWAGGSCDYSAGIKFAPNDYWYTIISFGDIQDNDEMGNMHVFESRMGLKYNLLNNFYIQGDLGSGTALPYNVEKWEDEDSIWGIFDARVGLGLQFGKRFSIFGGVSSSYKGHGKDWDDDKSDLNPFFGIQF